MMEVIQENNKFDPIFHKAPKYDIYGNLKKTKVIPGEDPRNILKEADSIKLPWNGQSTSSEPMTQTKLWEQRKKEKNPHPTFDLDGDGFVGGRDYFLANKFDKDKDGRLNEHEKANAYREISNGYEDNFVWNLENQGSNRGYRIMQKRGKIVDCEDFLPVRDTYPEHPISKNKPKYQTQKQLQEARRNEIKETINQKMKKWEESNPQVFINEPMDPKLSVQPKFQSYKQIKSANHRAAREKLGLIPESTDIKITNKDPSLNYVYNPENKTHNDLKEKYKKENMEQFFKLNEKHYLNDVERLNLRENEIIAQGYQSEDRQTLSKIKEIRKKQTVQENMEKFSKQTIGVHGHELPKFSENEEYKEYWKYKKDYVENPDINSHALLKEKIKYWKEPEELILMDHLEGIPQPDSFKKVFKPKEKNNELIIKVNELNHFKDFDPKNPKPIDLDNPPRNHIYKWTTLVNQFAPSKFKGRYFDSLPQEAPRQTDLNPLYSSFGVNGVFQPTKLKNVGKKQEDKFSNGEGEKILNDNLLNANRESLYFKLANRDVKLDKPEKANNLFERANSKVRTKGFN